MGNCITTAHATGDRAGDTQGHTGGQGTAEEQWLIGPVRPVGTDSSRQRAAEGKGKKYAFAFQSWPHRFSIR